MNPVLRCDWLPKRARCSYVACSGLLAVSYITKFPWKSFFINTLLIKLVRSRWLHIVCVFNTQKIELGQYAAILSSRLVDNSYLFLQTNSKTPKRRKVLQDFQRKSEAQETRVDTAKCQAIHDCEWVDGGKTATLNDINFWLFVVRLYLRHHKRNFVIAPCYNARWSLRKVWV